MIKIIVLGISGSIGKQTLSLIDEFSDTFCLVGCSVNENLDFLNEVISTHPSIQKVCVGDSTLVSKVNFNNVVVGQKGLEELVNLDCDLVVNAVSGIAGLYPTLKAIQNNKNIAIANKEAIVCGGDLILQELKNHPSVNIYPIDSEHSALLQCLNGEKKEDIETLLITASGGAFRDYSLEELKNVKAKDALNHPNWLMGKKITVDCATLFNKGLEVIEAHYLFGVDYDHILAVMHKQSLVHSLVEFKDGTIKALLASADMRLNILYAISGLSRRENSCKKLNLLEAKNLTFEPLRNDIFKGYDLAIKAGRIGGSMPCCMSVANEVAVSYFLDDKISFLDIYDIVDKVMSLHTVIKDYTLEDILKVEKETRIITKELIERSFK